MAYSEVPDQSMRLFKVRAHEVRALSASWALFNGVPFEDIMTAAFWRGHTTFTDYYLRTLSQHSDGLYSLGPIVAAQSVVCSSTSQ